MRSIEFSRRGVTARAIKLEDIMRISNTVFASAFLGLLTRCNPEGKGSLP
jgi:hypothetical protein